jgi:hypothetical protein
MIFAIWRIIPAGESATLRGRLKVGHLIEYFMYSRTPHNPYPSVDGPGYGLLEVMGFERSAKNRVKKITKKS